MFKKIKDIFDEILDRPNYDNYLKKHSQLNDGSKLLNEEEYYAMEAAKPKNQSC